jgi:hypothetical protein
VLDGLDALKRAFDEGQDLGQALRAERDAAAAGLGAQRAWITAFGLAGGEGPLAVPDLQEPWPFEELRKQAERRRVGLAIPPLPDETPVGVARELRAIAAEARRRWLAPVRAELRRRVEALGMGRETPAAWKRLLTEYLGPQARNDLADWLAVDATLRHLAGQPPGDPLNQLVRFLRRDKWALPLEGVALELPAAVKTAGGDHHLQADPDHPLQIRRRTAAGEETKIFLIVVAARDGDRYRLSLAPNTPLAQGALPFEPGDRLSAQIQVYSREGQWLLTWPDTESPSAVYGFAALTRPPRLHPFTETDPIKGEVAFGVRLVFPEPEAWQLPELLE